jgi:hypothetical protein
MNVTRNIGMLLLALYLIMVAVGLIWAIITPSVVLGVVALLAAVFIIVGK